MNDASSEQDTALCAEAQAILHADDVQQFQRLMTAHGSVLLAPKLWPSVLDASIRHGAFGCLTYLLSLEAPSSHALIDLVDLDVPQAVDDTWIYNVARTVQLVRASAPWDTASLEAARERALQRHAWATWLALDPPEPPTEWLEGLIRRSKRITSHATFWVGFFAARATDDTLHALANNDTLELCLRNMLYTAIDRRKMRREAFALGGVRRNV